MTEVTRTFIAQCDLVRFLCLSRPGGEQYWLFYNGIFV